LNIPYTSCNAATSAITFNKRYTVAVARMAGVAVANSVHLFRNITVPVDQLASQVKLPVFVKPNNGGSSIGMSKVDREFTVGVFKTKGNIVVLPITEVRAHQEKSFFDFEAKYEGKSTEMTPADLDEASADKIREEAKKIYRVFNCRGVVLICLK
jgi:D-alanine-D-alanine ligase